MGSPVNECVMAWERKRCSVKWIDMSPHTIVFFFRNQAFSLDNFSIALVLFGLFAVLSFSLHKRNNNIINNFMIQLIWNYSSQLEQYFYMQYQAGYIDKLAKSSLYDTNNDLKLKSENELTKILFHMPLAQYSQLLETSSEEVVLVVAAILRRNAHALGQHTTSYMLAINQLLMYWYHPRGVLIRSLDYLELKFYVLNTFGQFMGSCMKILFSDPHGKNMVISLLKGMEDKPHYQLFLYYCFIESVSIIDGDTTYVNHRTLLSSFQETLIPRIFQALYPYFMTISDSMEITQLSFLQSQLTMNENAQNRKAYNLSLSQQKNAFTEMVFKLLDQVIAFRYNFSQKQYDSLDDFQNTMISFPEFLLSELINNHFLQSLYNILMQLMRTNETNYQQICLNCLKKILLAKIIYIPKNLQDLFVAYNLEGVFRLLQLILNSKHGCQRENIVHILQCNINFMIAFGLDKIIGCSLKSQKHQEFFRGWMELTNMIPVYILENEDQPINFQNQLFLAGSQMLVKLATQFKIHSIKFDKEKYVPYYKRYTQKFIDLFVFKGTNINGTKELSVEEFKNSCQFLSEVKCIMTYNYEEVFTCLDQCCNFIYQGVLSQFCIGNFILLLRETLREVKFLEESIFGNGIIQTRSRQMQVDASNQMKMFGEIIWKTLQFIRKYMSQTFKSFGYLNNAIIFFLSTFVECCTKRISTGDNEDKPVKPFIDYEVYKQVKIKLGNIDDEFFVLSLLQELAKFTGIPNINSFDYIFTILYQNIVIIKFNMRRQHFKKTQIYKKLVLFFEEICLHPTLIQFMKSRVILFKTIVALSFDDSVDEYRVSIRKVLTLLKQELDAELHEKLLYDLTGIFEAIQGQTIFKYFLRYLHQQFNFSGLLSVLFSLALKNPFQYLSDVFHLFRLFISNKCNRFNSGKGIELAYAMINKIIPYWIRYLQNGVYINEYVLTEVYLGVHSLFKEQHINICLLDKIAQPIFRSLVTLVLKSMVTAIDSLQSCPELAQAYFNLAILFTTQVAKPLFNLTESQVAWNIHTLINTFMKKLTLNFQTIANGVFLESLTKPMLETVNLYYTFLRQHKRIKHLKYLAVNIKAAIADYVDKELFLQTIMKIAMDFRQYISDTIDKIANLCVDLIEFHDIRPENVIGKLGLTDKSDIKQLQRIFHHIREGVEDNQWLTSQMKDWLKNKTRFSTTVEIDY